ncbi:hypothetical protein CGLO_05149 [Colletotrichum gloeosporioides Cg-14]|uniref:F-box domain-containing protein n=1 Tax=Colletotrichum gloeosporioides (strain Cg-14) TaxID=1237896 RepID=T0LTB4_COLGC|nr:hypothetical protein CGLO_05149 [Colletotrichum gloeosporioides Cg-14]
MATLSKLPPELIREICLHIHEHDLDQPDNQQNWIIPQKALASLCKVSKAFCNTAQPILFRRVHITVRRQNLIPHNTKLIALLRVLIKRPHLGEQIRLLKLSVHEAGHHWINRLNLTKPVAFIPLEEDDFQLFTNAAKRESWMGDLSAHWDNNFLSEE